jgi:hypothetical protein
VDDEVDALGVTDSNLEELAGTARADEHEEIVEAQDADGVVVCVEQILVVYAVLACAGEDDRIHLVKVTC